MEEPVNDSMIVSRSCWKKCENKIGFKEVNICKKYPVSMVDNQAERRRFLHLYI